MNSSADSRDRPIALIGAPTDIGAGRRGASMGPEALRVAGLAVSLTRMGYRVSDRGNIDGPLNPEAKPVDGYRHLNEVQEWCAKVRDEVFLDPEIAPGVPTVVPGGPTYREAQLCMEMISDSACLASLDIVELNPACDLQNKTAELVVELVESLFGERTLARTHEKEKYRL